MRIVLVDLEARDGLVTKDTVAGGYGSRFVPFSHTTRWFCRVKRSYVRTPSIQMAYLAALCSRAGHEVLFTRDRFVAADVALMLSSLVDYRREIAWADAARALGIKVGFVGLACSKMPELFERHADFIVAGEPEGIIQKILDEGVLSGTYQSPEVADLNSLPFPRWDLLGGPGSGMLGMRAGAVLPRVRFSVLASRSCPEFCTYCPHRILTGYRSRSVANIVQELEEVCGRHARPFIIFRDPLFTRNRDRCLELCEEILRRGLRLQFECETRLDHLDEKLLRVLNRAGLRAITFGVESVRTQTLRKVARRPIPEAHQRSIMEECRRLGIQTAAFYVFGFLEDTWDSIAATIDYAIGLESAFAQFKILTPYPGTPLWKQLRPLVYESDWQKFDGYTPTFRHPHLKPEELQFLLGAAYARFYLRPSFLNHFCPIRNSALARLVDQLDRRTCLAHAQNEISLVSRAVTC